jgi:hypothetical protein
MTSNNRKISQIEGITRLGKSQLNYIIANLDQFDVSSGLFISPGNIVKDIRAVKTLLVKYHDALDEEGKMEVRYEQLDGSGRYYNRAPCGMALQTMTRKVRHTICQHNQIDFDMKNCHPVLLAWYCQEHDIPCEFLKYYCDHRDECIQSLKKFPVGEDFSAPKALVCAIINGGNRDYKQYFETWAFQDCDLPEWFSGFVKQLRQVIIPAIIKKHPEQFAKLKQKCKHKKFDNPYGSLMSYVMTKMENECLMAAKDWVESVGIKPACLAYDGMHLYSDNLPMSIADIEKGMSDAVKRATGRCVVWSQKPFKEAFDMTAKGWTPDYKPVDLRLIDGVFPHTDLIKPFAIVPNDFVRVVEIPESVKWVSQRMPKLAKKSNSNISNSGIQYPPSLEQMFEKDKVVSIRSAMGTGKTYAICKFIKRNRIPRVLVLSPRISYASSIANEYNQEAVYYESNKFKAYTSVKKKSELNRYPRLVCSMESLHYLDTNELSRNPFDLLVCDESHANLTAHVCSATNGSNFEANQLVMETLMRTTPKIIFADAFMGAKTLDYIQLMRYKTTLYNYKAKMVARTAVNVPAFYFDSKGDRKSDRNALLPVLIDSLKKGERNYVFVASAVRLRDWAELLKEEFPNKKIKSYTSGQGKSIKDVNKEWGCCDCVLTTCTITVGINFNKKDWFHNVFVCASMRCNNLISDIFQAHYRVRHLINNKMYYSLSAIEIDDKQATSRCEYKNVMTHNVEAKEAFSLLWNPDCAKASDSMKALVASVEQEVRLSTLRLELMFNYYLMLCNYTVEVLPTETRSPFDCGHNIDIPAFDEIVLITPEQECNFRKIQISSSQCLTEEELWKLRKYHFVVFTSEKDDEDWLFESNNNTREQLWRLYNRLRGSYHSFRRHERIRKKIESIEEIRERSMARNRFALFQEHRWEKTAIVEGVIECLDLGFLHNLGVEVSYNLMREFYKENADSASTWSRLFDPGHSGRDKKQYENCSFKHFVGLVNKILRKVSFAQLVQKRVMIQKQPPEKNKHGKFKQIRDPTAPWVLKQSVTTKTKELLGYCEDDELPSNLASELISVFDFYNPFEKKTRLLPWSCSNEGCSVQIPWDLNPSGRLCEVCRSESDQGMPKLAKKSISKLSNSDIPDEDNFYIDTDHGCYPLDVVNCLDDMIDRVVAFS